MKNVRDSGTSATTLDRVRRQAEAVVNGLAVLPGADWTSVVAKVESVYGKPIKLRSVDDGQLAQLSGLWIDTKAYGIVHYRAGDPTFYQAHSIAHELGHILMNHDDCNVLRSIDLSSVPEIGVEGEVQRARGRGLLRTPDEEIAEQIAYVLARRMLLQLPSPEEDVLG